MPSLRVVLLSLLLVISGAAVGVSAALAGSGPALTSSFVTTAPTIDGTLADGEWGSGQAISLNGFNDPSRTRSGELYLLNTATDLYVALVLEDPTQAEGDVAELNIDVDHDHKATSGKDDALRSANGSFDMVWQGSDWAVDAAQHGVARRSHAGGKYTYEFRKPLNSGDAQDMAASPGSTIGFRIQVFDSGINEFFRYPAGSRGHGDTAVEWAKWSDLTLASAQLAPPALAQPAPNAQLQAMTTTLSWSNPSGATQAHVQVTPANNDGPGVNLILSDASSLQVPAPPDWYGLLPGMSYTWRVRATTATTSLGETSDQWGPWSEGRKFRTPDRNSSRLSPVSPANLGSVAAGPQTLRWANGDADVFYYEIQVTPDPRFGEGGPVASVWHNLIHGGVANPTNSWRTPDIAPATTYYWRVRPRVQGDGTPVAWGTTWSFGTQSGGASTPVSPSPGVYYATCADARAAGAAPIYRGQPGYRAELDRDGDGIACET